MFRHIALFRWQEGTTDEDVAAITEALRALPAEIPELREYVVGPDAAVSEGNFDFAVVADFDDPTGYEVYATHPAHLAVATGLIRPRLAERAAVQHHR